MLGLAASLPPGDPLRGVGDARPPSRLSSVTGWRAVGLAALDLAGVSGAPVEQRLHVTLPPWTQTDGITFALDVGARGGRDAPDGVRLAAAETCLAALPQEAVYLWTDGSAEAGVSRGGGGAVVRPPSGEETEVRVQASEACSSTRAELTALLAALRAAAELTTDPDLPVVVCTDSQAALRLLSGGPAAQCSFLGAAVWRALLELRGGNRRIHLQWVPAHCGLPGNERADTLAKEAAGMAQEATPVDARTLSRAAARAARKKWQESWPAGWYRDVMADRVPPPIRAATREAAVDVHQLRSGHWGRSEQYLHRIGRRPTADCNQCNDTDCPAGRCLVCGEAADTPAHVLL